MLSILRIIAILFIPLFGFSQTMTLHPMLNSIGVQISLPNDYDPDKTAHCFIQYKKSAETTWIKGHDADRVLVEGNDQFRGSLFLLEEGVAYDVQVTLTDSIPVVSVQTLAVQTILTLATPQFTPTATVKWVAPDGNGTAYTETQPGNIKTLLSSGTVACGTTVMIKDGLYTDLNLALTLTADCDEAHPIQFLAAPGAQPVFDGGYSAPLVWTQHPNDPKLYSAALPAGTDFTNLCLLNGQMLYPYPVLNANVLFGNYNLVDLNLETDGFVRDNNTIWIKTAAGIDPNAGTVVLSKTFRFLTVYGNDKNAYLKFKGIAVKHIAKSSISGAVSFTAIAFDLRKLHHVTFDSCTLEYNNSNIVFSDPCNDILVQNSRVKHGNGLWSHAMTKKSNVESVFFTTSMGRAGETGAVTLSDNTHVIVRHNYFDGINSGVVSNFDTGLIEEADINDNVFVDNFDAIECDGNWCNLRVWNNEIIRPMAGFSIAPPMIGPRYFYRNIVHHLQGRHNEQDDPYFIGCTPVSQYNSQSIGIKTNSGLAFTINPANLYFINNTFYSEDTLGFAYTFWEGEWKNINFVNNIFCSTNNHLGYFQGFLNKDTFQMRSRNDNYFCSNPSKPLFVIKEIHGQFTCHAVFGVDEIAPQLSAITGSHDISFLNPFQQDPGFLSTAPGGFELAENSPLIDQGEIVPGFYDYTGSKPDLGAKETAGMSPVQEVYGRNVIRVYPNPTNAGVTIDFKERIVEAQVLVFNGMGQVVVREGIEDESMVEIRLPELGGLYFVSLKMGGTRYHWKVMKVGAK